MNDHGSGNRGKSRERSRAICGALFGVFGIQFEQRGLEIIELPLDVDEFLDFLEVSEGLPLPDQLADHPGLGEGEIQTGQQLVPGGDFVEWRQVHMDWFRISGRNMTGMAAPGNRTIPRLL